MGAGNCCDTCSQSDWHHQVSTVAKADLSGVLWLFAGGPNMDKVFFFEFESRTWSARPCKDVLPSWSFGHATKRGRSIFALGSPRGETGTLEVGDSHGVWGMGSVFTGGRNAVPVAATDQIWNRMETACCCEALA